MKVMGYISAFNLQYANGEARPFPPMSGGAGVEKEDPFPLFGMGQVGMAEDDDVRFFHPDPFHFGGEIASPLDHPVGKINRLIFYLEDFNIIAAPANRVGIGIPGNGAERRERLQFGEDIFTPHVAGMENQVGSMEKVENLRMNDPVGIGKNADFHGLNDTAFSPPQQ